MSWYTSLADGIKSRLCKYALQSFLGEYLLDEVSIDQLSLDIYNGTGTIQNLRIDEQAVNRSLAKTGIPLQLVEGFISSITVSVPWKNLINDDTSLEIHGLEATLQPRSLESSDSSEFDTSWMSQSHMATSMQLAEECLKEEKEVRSTPDGLQNASKIIDSVISRVRFTLIDSIVRIEDCALDASQGKAVELHIGRLAFFDDTLETEGSSVDAATYSVKNITISDLSMYTDVFLPCHRNTSQSQMSSTMSSDIFSSALSVQSGPIIRQPSYVSSSTNQEGLPHEKTCLNSKPVKFFSTVGESKIKIFIKNDNQSAGAKLKFEVQLNSLAIFLSPNQVHLLSDLLSSFGVNEDELPPEEKTVYSEPSPTAGKNRQMTADQLNQVENDMQFQLTSRLLAPGQLNLEQLKLGEIDTFSVDSGMFQSVKGHLTGADPMTTSFHSGYSTSLGSTVAASTAYQLGMEPPSTSAPRNRIRTNPKSPPQSKKVDETRSQSTLVNGRITYVAVVVLNEDPVSTPGDALQPGESASDKMKKLAERFYDSFLSHHSRGVTTLSLMRDDVETSCPVNHLKLLVKNADMNVQHMSEQRSRKKRVELSLVVNLHLCEVTEWVKADDKVKVTYPAFNTQETSKILTFSGPTADASGPQPCIRLSYNSTTSQLSQKQEAKTSSTATIEFCRRCHAEIDISITDRLNDLLNHTPTPSGTFSPNTSHMAATSSPLRDKEPPKTTSNTEFQIKSDLDVVLNLRFPIADLRTDPDQKYNWWSRKLRQEILELHVTKPRVTIPLSSELTDFEMEFTCRSTRAFFVMGADSRFAIANIGQELVDKEGLEWPRILVKSYAVKVNSLLDDEHPDSFDSLNGACSEVPVCEPSPFSGRKAMYSHNDELKIPGSKREMSDFEHLTKSNTQLYVHIDLPAVNVVIPSKKVLEVLYNRVCNDLLLWEPLAPVPGVTSSSPNSTKVFGVEGEHRLSDLLFLGASKYMPCKSTLVEGDSDEEVDDLGEEMIYSIHDPKAKKKGSYQRNQSVVQQHGQSKACVYIGIKRGLLTLIHPSLDGDKSVLANCHGKSMLHIKDGVIYVNSKSLGDPNLSFISIHSGQCALYHDGCIKGSYQHPAHVERMNSMAIDIPIVLDLCTDTIPNNLGYEVGCRGEEDMLGVAVRVALDPDPKKLIKNVVVSVSLKRSCLHHKMVDSQYMWIIQLIDALGLDDYDVLGYTFPQVHTELHFHVLGSVISYIPKNLPYAGLLTLEKFSISSNVIVNSPMSLLTFLVEDAALYLSDRDSQGSLNVKQDYVRLVQLNFFKLDWKSSDGKNPKYPKTDISIQCSTLHLATCADSCLALQAFIVYLADNGDIPPPEISPEPLEPLEEGQCTPLAQSVSGPSAHRQTGSPHDKDEDKLPNLMMDAMEDSVVGPVYSEKQDRQKIPEDTFLFPGETLEDDDEKTYSLESDADLDGGFCFLEKPDIPENGHPVITKLDSESIKPRENFFATTVNPVNLLLPPKNFPEAVSRYCLANLNVVWDLYGGHDFGKRPHKEYPIANPPAEVARDNSKFIQLCLFKVQLHYELYPESTPQVSRQCLLIETAEVKDLVEASHIDKLLYRYSSEKYPFQKHTGLLCQKLVVHRPDLNRPERHEADVRVSIQPIKINLDQDTLQFIQELISAFGGKQEEPASNGPSYSSSNENISLGQTPPKFARTPPTEEPIMAMSFRSKSNQEEGKTVFDEMADETDTGQSGASAGSLLFIRNLVFAPEVPIRIDYVGKRIEFDQKWAGILKGLGQLKGSLLKLKCIHCRRGLLGMEKAVHMCLSEWLKDITRHQIPAIAGGFGPFGSLVQFFQGVQDLFWMPIEQYRKDGRVVRGLQRGANSFSTSTAIAVLELSNRAVQVIQLMAEVSNDLLSPNQLPVNHHLRYKHSQPRDVREGVSDAMNILSEDILKTDKQIDVDGNITSLAEGIGDTATTLYDAASDCKDKSVAAQIGAIARTIPGTVLAPVRLVPEATSKVLDSLVNQMDPDKYREQQAKYKSHHK